MILTPCPYDPITVGERGAADDDYKVLPHV